MKKIFLSLFIAIFLFACASPAEDVQVAEPTADAIPTASPIPTTEPLPTIELIPSNLYNIFKDGGLDVTAVENAKWTAGEGFEIGGEKISISDLEKRAVINKQGVLQILNRELTEVEYAFDAETNTFLFSNDYIYQIPSSNEYINEGFLDIDRYPALDDVANLSKFVASVKLFVKDLPPNVNLPDPGIFDIEHFAHKGIAPSPFGTLKDGEVNGTENFTFFKVRMDPINNPDLWTVCGLTLVPNIDGTFSLIPVTMPGGGDITYDVDGLPFYIFAATNHTKPGRVLLPTDIIRDFDHPTAKQRYTGPLEYFKGKGITFQNANTPAYSGKTVRMDFFTQLISQWLETGIVPKELEEVISMSVGVPTY